jgi:hypothetical protein
MFRFSLLTVAALIIPGLMGTNEAQAAIAGYNVMYRNTPSANWTLYAQAANPAAANATAAQLMQQGFLTEVVPVGVATSVPVATGGTYYAAPAATWIGGGYYRNPGYWGHYGYAGNFYGHHGYNHHNAYHHHNNHHAAHHNNHHAAHHNNHHAAHHGGGHHGGHHR